MEIETDVTPLWARGALADPDPDARVKQEQLRLLARHLHVVLPGSLIIAALLAWSFGNQTGVLPTLLWFSALALLTATRLAVIGRIRRKAEAQNDFRALKLLLLGGASLSGTIWGLGGILFFDPGNAPRFALLLIVLGGVVAGSLGPHSYYFPAYVLFSVPVLLPLVVMVFLQGGEFYTFVGMAMVLYLLLNLYYSRQYENMVIKSIRLQYSNEKLLDELQESNRRLHRYSYTDSLTGIANRRQFDSDFETSWKLARRAGEPLSLMLLDVDYYKDYNDRHGHARGDEVLRNIAGILMDICGQEAACGTPARIGGEEFAVLLHCDEERAWKISQLICSEIEKRLAKQGSNVTASIGTATRIPASTEGPEALFQAADNNLYGAKAAGRNCVVAR
jgi:diguanylate cyclase (GGDEF)-like protein